MIETSFLNFIESQLSIASKRQQVLSANIANVDTPDYRAQDVTFEDQMDLLNLVGTARGHMTLRESNAGFRMFDVGAFGEDLICPVRAFRIMISRVVFRVAPGKALLMQVVTDQGCSLSLARRMNG